MFCFYYSCVYFCSCVYILPHVTLCCVFISLHSPARPCVPTPHQHAALYIRLDDDTIREQAMRATCNCRVWPLLPRCRAGVIQVEHARSIISVTQYSVQLYLFITKPYAVYNYVFLPIFSCLCTHCKHFYNLSNKILLKLKKFPSILVLPTYIYFEHHH